MGNDHYMVDATPIAEAIKARGGPAAVGMKPGDPEDQADRRAYYRALKREVDYRTAERLAARLGADPWEYIDGWFAALPEWDEGTLTCPKCEQEKDRTEFSPAAEQGHPCRECMAVYRRGPCEGKCRWRLVRGSSGPHGAMYWRCIDCLHCQSLGPEQEEAA